MNDIDYKAVMEIAESFLNNEKVEILGISVGEERQVKQAIKNLIQRNKDLEQILELTSKSLDNISYDQMPIAIEELKFKLQNLEQIEKEHKEENGRLREEIYKKDKIINLIAEMLVKDHEWFYSEFDNYTKQDFIDYFTNKVEEDK